VRKSYFRVYTTGAKWVKEATPGEPAFSWIDVSECTITSASRKALPTIAENAGARFIAFVGVSFALRTVLNLTRKAMAMASRTEHNVLHFAVDESAARAWLAERRREHFARKGQQPALAAQQR
jgi:hypothetical protein